MTSLAVGTIRAVQHGIGGAITGSVLGYIYAKLADLSPLKVAQAYAIWCAAELAILEIGRVFFTKNSFSNFFMETTVTSLVNGFAIHEMRKRHLMGDKLMYFLIIMNGFVILNLLSKTSEQLEQNP